jgi:hypothetical protein
MGFPRSTVNPIGSEDWGGSRRNKSRERTEANKSNEDFACSKFRTACTSSAFGAENAKSRGRSHDKDVTQELDFQQAAPFWPNGDNSS